MDWLEDRIDRNKPVRRDTPKHPTEYPGITGRASAVSHKGNADDVNLLGLDDPAGEMQDAGNVAPVGKPGDPPSASMLAGGLSDDIEAPDSLLSLENDGGGHGNSELYDTLSELPDMGMSATERWRASTPLWC